VVALPLHPEYRTLPMVWYIPPLSPVVEQLRAGGHDAEDAANLFGAVNALRIPVGYLAELFTAGDPGPVDAVLRRLAAMRAYMRDLNLGEPARPEIAEAVGMTAADLLDMHRLLAVAKYDERYVIPPAHPELGDARQQAHQLEELACSLDYAGGPGMGGSGPFGESSGVPVPVAVETFHALKDRQTSDHLTDPSQTRGRVNLLNWDGKGRPEGLFPPKVNGPTPPPEKPEKDALGDERNPEP
jgi:nitrate reductase beta subunit